MLYKVAAASSYIVSQEPAILVRIVNDWLCLLGMGRPFRHQ